MGELVLPGFADVEQTERLLLGPLR